MSHIGTLNGSSDNPVWHWVNYPSPSWEYYYTDNHSYGNLYGYRFTGNTVDIKLLPPPAMTKDDAKLIDAELEALGLSEPTCVVLGALVMTLKPDIGQFILNLRRYRQLLASSEPKA